MPFAPRCGEYGGDFGSDARPPNSGRGASRLHSHAARGNEDNAAQVPGKSAWWLDNGVVYIKSAAGAAQGFTVR